MFGAYGIVQQSVGFFGRVLQHPRAGSAERYLLGLRDFLAAREATDDVAAEVVEGDTGSRENPAAKPLAFVQEPEEDVLGLDGARPGLADLGASVEEDVERSLGEPIEHTRPWDTS